VNNTYKGIVIAAFAIVASMVIITLSIPGGFNNLIAGQLFSNEPKKDQVPNNAIVASVNTPPRLVLTALKTDEDGSAGMTSFDANNTTPIALVENQHIRFESPDYRTPDSMKAVAIAPNGKISILLKSYDVNNEFFINLGKGNYDIKVQTRWLEQTYIYSFKVTVGS
jgi:hypothetical protein